jgi:hypothetical protein
MNNTYDTYSGITSLGMIALSTALTAGVQLLFEGLASLLSLIKGTPEDKKTRDGRFILGSSTKAKLADPNAFPPNFPLDIGALLGIRPTLHRFSDCLKVGTLAFFGISSDGTAGALVTIDATAITSAPGYNSVVARAVIRSISSIIESIKKIFQSNNLVSGVKNLLSMLDVLRHSKLVSALNVFSTLGDKILTDSDFDNISAPGEPVRRSSIDKLPDDVPSNVIGKNRMGDGKNLKLAWSSNRAPALYLLPNATLALQATTDNLGSFQSGIASEDADTRAQYYLLSNDASKKNGNRIPVGKGSDNDNDVTLRNMERALDAEYIPFYFHDVRTNEIIAFHAFLSSLSDDYTANYESSDGFGRVEPVKIYKSTVRKIGLSFYVAATSPADFKDMWVKINKLTTLIYPQYSEGRWLSDKDNNYAFTQPFSQMIAASPLVRLRLGNLLSTNYSRFALARLFGATLGGDSVAQFGDSSGLDFDAGNQFKVPPEIIKSRTTPSEKTWFVTPGQIYDSASDAGKSNPLPSNQVPSAPRWKVDAYADMIPVNVVSTTDDADVVAVQVKMPDAAFFNSQGITDPARQAALTRAITNLYNNDKDPLNKIINQKFLVKSSELRPTQSTLKAINQASGAKVTSLDSLSNFLDPEKNALVKSFKSAGGRGLAGFIDSMNFDWYDKVNWDDRPGHKAPMMCKVTISFTPIHDISPGLDSQGYNRAPIYPVGYFAPSTDTDDKK